MIRRLLVLFIVVTGLAAFAPSTAMAAAAGEMCAGYGNIRCDRGLWCDRRPGRCHGYDIAGTCARITSVCTFVYQPVCGCNGRTFGNDCQRRNARVFKLHDGPCRRPSKKG